MAMDPKAAAMRLAKLRENRARPQRDDALAPAFQRTARDLARLEKNLSGITEAWESVCPPDLLPRTAIRSIHRGKLTIAVADAATRFELDRLLRAGAKRDLVRGCPMTVRDVRLVQDATVEQKHTQ